MVIFWCISRTLTFSHCLRNGLAIWMNDLGSRWSVRSLWSSFMFFRQSAVLACNCLYHSESTLTFHISVFNSFLTVLECPGENGDWGHHRKLPHRKLPCPKRTRLVGADPPGCIQSGGKLTVHECALLCHLHWHRAKLQRDGGCFVLMLLQTWSLQPCCWGAWAKIETRELVHNKNKYAYCIFPDLYLVCYFSGLRCKLVPVMYTLYAISISLGTRKWNHYWILNQLSYVLNIWWILQAVSKLHQSFCLLSCH